MKKKKKILISSIAALTILAIPSTIFGIIETNKKQKAKTIEYLKNNEISINYPNKENISIGDANFKNILFKTNDSDILISDVKIISRNWENGSIEIQYVISKDKNSVKKTKIINGFSKESKNDWINKEKNKLNNINVTFNYQNKETFLPSNAVLEKINYEIKEKNNVRLKDLKILRVNDSEGELFISYSLNLNFENETIKVEKTQVISGFKRNLKTVLSSQDTKELEIEKIQNVANSIKLDYQNKINILASKAKDKTKIIFTVSDNDFEIDNKSIIINNYDDRYGKLNVTYKVKSKKYDDVFIVVNEENNNITNNTITGFKTEKQRLDEISNLEINYENKETLLPSEVDKNNFKFIFEENTDAKVKNLEITNTDDENGITTISFFLSSGKEGLEDIISSQKQIKLIDGFDSWKKRKNTEIKRLNNLVKNNSSNVVINTKINKSEITPQEVNKNNLEVVLDNNFQEATISNLVISQTNNEEGWILVKFYLSSKKEHFQNVESTDFFEIKLPGFKQINNHDNELKKLNQTKWILDYSNKENLEAETAIEKNIVLTNGKENNAEIAYIQITQKNNLDRSITVSYKVKSNERENVISNIFEATINNFKKVKTNEEIEKEIKLNLDNLNPNYSYKNKENVLVDNTNKEDIIFSLDNQKINAVNIEITEKNTTNNLIKFKYQLQEIAPSGKIILSNWKTGQIEKFKEIKLSAKEEKLKNDLDLYYKAEYSSLLKENPNIHIFSKSVNTKNAKYLLNLDTKEAKAKLEVLEVEIDKNNLDNFKVLFKASREGISINYVKTFTAIDKINTLYENIKYSQLDELYDIDYQRLYKTDFDLIKNNKELQNELFKPKFKNLNSFLDYEIDFKSFKTNIKRVNKSATNIFGIKQQTNVFEAKIQANILIFFGGKKVKTIENLISKEEVIIPSLNNLGIKYKPSEHFKNSGYFKDNLDIQDYLNKEVERVAKKQGYKGNLAKIWNSTENVIVSRSKVLYEVINDNFDFEFNGYKLQQYDILEFWADSNKGYGFYIINKNKDKNSVDFILNFLKDKQKYEIPFSFQVTHLINDFQDEKIYSMVANNQFSEILSNLKVKNKNQTHNNIIASKIYDEFNNLYELPSSLNYSIKFLKPEIKDQELYDDNKGWAKIQFELYKNNSPTGIKSKIFTLNNFKPLSRYDFVPANRWFNESDFYNPNSSLIPDENTRKLMDEINATDFTYNYAQDSKRVVDVSAILSQKAYDKLNYLFKFTGPVNLTDEEKKNAEINKKLFEKNENNFEKPPAPIEIPNDKGILYTKGTEQTSVNVNDLAKNWYIYFFDVTGGLDRKGSGGILKFKLGFINKKNPRIRWFKNASKNDNYSKFITLNFLQNDYALENIGLNAINNIKRSDFDFFRDYNFYRNYALSDNEKSEYLYNKITAQNFAKEVKNINSKWHKIFNFINIPSYGNSRIKVQRNNTNDIVDFNIRVAETKFVDDRNGSLFLRFKYSPSGFTNQDKDVYESDTWFEVSGFKKNTSASSINKKTMEEMLKEVSAKYGMKKIVLENRDIYRQRRIEMRKKDNFFTKSNDSRLVSWKFKKEYYKLLLNENITNGKINFHFYTNFILLDDSRAKRIFEPNQGLNITIDWDELKKSKKIEKTYSSEKFRPNNSSEENQIQFKTIFELKEDGINFSYQILGNNNYKIIDDEGYKELFLGQNNFTNNFDPSKAVYFQAYLGAKVTISYKNKTEMETFSKSKTNILNYNKMSFTAENQPIVLYNEKYDNEKIFEYDPNQNLPYKFNEGYKVDYEYLHFSYKNEKLKETFKRSFAFNNGTGFMLGKLNDDPKNGLFIGITNNHVVNNNSTNSDPSKGKWINVTFTRPGDKYANAVDEGFGYWSGLYTTKVKIFPFWTGVNQVSDDRKTTKSVDLTMFLIDVNDLIKNAKNEGKYETAFWYEEWFKLKRLNLNSRAEYVDNKLLEYINSQNHLNWENQAEFSSGRLFNGWPYGKQSSYIVNRNSNDSTGENFSKPRENNNYVPIFWNAGNSGTGVFDGENTYVSTINSGSPLKFLKSWYGISKPYNNNDYSRFNYFGFIENNQNILSLPNKDSASLNLFKLGTVNENYDLPYWIKNELNK
ncbi:MGA_1079 family surface serine endopeptidase [Mycoplasmopsis meleagridis]|uniref:MGA_1079 family surface serine endopeptidase n=1 Tax=Mycoplasmopsis meleagridis TaxID=29561 RepID=UPI00073D6E6E|nr:lipoprotein 17-related variable surface protein [Mycoplasmopsis meleagridis]KUH47309.1 hypothetical protein ASB56_02210 [Mycoplasmopsis meleagridis]